MSELTVDPLIRSAAPILAEAAGRVACPQIRNRATIGGNLCNASPAADTAVPLILLDATVELTSWSGADAAIRQVPITDFFRGPGATVLAPGEILTAIRFKPAPENAFAAWDKLGTRPSMEIAVASVGVALELEAGVVARARVGYGSVAPIPLRGRHAETELLGNPLSEEVIEKCVAAARAEITPISDVRAGATYRREVVGVMLRRMLEHAAGQRQD
jgi:CO/xanthine dehydrogenase FAD-binding subunit